MFHMKRKTLALFAGGLGALSLLAMAEKQRRSHLGTIAVLYTNPVVKGTSGLTGGIVLEDGRTYRFAYADDVLTYEEEQA